jgi:hypothetical protein
MGVGVLLTESGRASLGAGSVAKRKRVVGPKVG